MGGRSRGGGVGLGLLLLVSILGLFIDSTEAHIRLTFPPARYPALDFLDNARTLPPCGVPKPTGDKAKVTTLHSGSSMNLTWWMSAAHQGGFQVHVLDASGSRVLALTPGPGADDYFGINDQTSTTFLATLPDNWECRGCTIQLVRQALEWGPHYMFHSCADVDIVAQVTEAEMCSGHGRFEGGKCVCKRLHFGSHCQYHDYCYADHDCGDQGLCFPTGLQSPGSYCYCKIGYFGPDCRNPSVVEKRFLPSNYHKRTVGDNNNIFWRIIEETKEMEMILQFPSTTWLAVGWRPRDISRSCGKHAMEYFSTGKLPPTTTATPSTVKTVPEPSPLIPVLPHHTDRVTAATPGSGPDHVLRSDKQKNGCALNPCGSDQVCVVEHKRCFTEPCPQYRCEQHTPEFRCPANESLNDCGSLCEKTCETAKRLQCPQEKICQAYACVCNEFYVRKVETGMCVLNYDCKDPIDSGVTKSTVGGGVTLSTADGTTEHLVCHPNESPAQCGRRCEPTCRKQKIENCPKICDPPACHCRDGLVRRDDGECVDPAEGCPATTIGPINIGGGRTQRPIIIRCTAFEQFSECGSRCEPRCEDLAQDTSTPCVEVCDPPSCACRPGFFRLSTGGPCVRPSQCPRIVNGSFGREPPTTPAVSPTFRGPVTIIPELATKAKTTTTTRQTSRPTTRKTPRTSPTTTKITTTTSPPVDPEVIGDVCYGDWRWPAGCRDCDYRVSWTYLDDTDEIEFSIETKAPSNWWTGIGFSRTGLMAQSDMIVVKSTRQNMTVHDMYSDGYGQPRMDASQDVYNPTNVVGTHVNGILRATFTRKRNTGDKRDDHQFTDSGCMKMLFPVTGGRLGRNGEMLKHIGTPQNKYLRCFTLNNKVEVSRRAVCILSCQPSVPSTGTGGTGTAPKKEDESCDTEFRYPTGCQLNTTCEYLAKWEYDEVRKDVKFEISSRDIGRWTGIGLNRKGEMTNSDIYTGWVYDGKAYVTDRFAYGRQLPAIDPSDRQNIYSVSGSVRDDIQTISFRRKIVTEDKLTDFPLNKCYYFLFPVGGGRVLARKSGDFQNPETPIGYHDLYQPKISRKKICICGKDGMPIKDKEEASRRKRQADPFGPGVAHPEAGLPPVVPHSEPEPEPAAEHAGHDHDHHEHGHAEPGSDDSGLPPLHPMDCMDVVIGSGKPNSGHVKDYYTPSRATPMVDEYFGGEQSLTASSAFEEDGVTTVMFRKKLTGNDKVVDHDILDQPMTVIWAKGMVYPDYNVPANIFKTGLVSTPEFYVPDVAQYHGTKNRGHFDVNFFRPDDALTTQAPKVNLSNPMCKDVYTSECDGQNCKYRLEWTVINPTKVTFKLLAHMQLNTWSGVGFSATGTMGGADMILVSLSESGDVMVLDYQANGYSHPEVDGQQAVFDINTDYKDGVVLAEFSRDLNSNDAQDVRLDQCQFFLYPTTPGPLGSDGMVSKHGVVPERSSNPICLQNCWQGVKPVVQPEPIPEGEHSTIHPHPEVEPTAETHPGHGHAEPTAEGEPVTHPETHSEPPTAETSGKPKAEPTPEGEATKPHGGHGGHAEPTPEGERTKKPTTTSKPALPKKTTENVKGAGAGSAFARDTGPDRYRLRFTIANREWNKDYEDLENPRTKKLSAEVLKPIDNVMRQRLKDKYKGANILDYAKGSVIAAVEVRAVNTTKEEVAQHLDDASVASNHQLGDLKLKPHSASATRCFLTCTHANPSINNLRNWIIIGVAILLVILAIIFAICMICRTRKTKSKDFTTPTLLSRYHPFSPPYSYVSTNGYASTYGYGMMGGPMPYPMTDKKGLDNQAYQAPLPTGHNRQFSQATTASAAGNNGVSPTSSGDASGGDESPRQQAGNASGMGETTYSEWYSKVARQDGKAAAYGAPGAPPGAAYPGSGDPMGYYGQPQSRQMRGGARPPY